MQILKKMSGLMENTTAYRLWQAPFADAKLAPILHHNDFSKIQRVLDVGCGPGTNCRYFEKADYTGFDINPRYIDYACRKYRRNFMVQDVCTFEAPMEQRFDFVLLNSLLHHLTDPEAHRVLGRLSHLVSPGGYVHIVELVLPEYRGIPRWLAVNDRGNSSVRIFTPPFSNPIRSNFWESNYGISSTSRGNRGYERGAEDFCRGASV
jgi:SAM-dependent methyltransferase